MKQFVLGFVALVITFQSTFAPAAENAAPPTLRKGLPDIEALSRDLSTSVELRAYVLTMTNDLRSLELLKRKMERELTEASRRVTIIKAMLDKTGTMQSISKEAIYSDANFLLYGCYLQRALDPFLKANVQSEPFGRFSAPKQAAFCTTMDVLVTASLGGAAALSSQNAKHLAADILKSEKEARVYPKTAWLFRASIGVFAAIAVVQNSLSWSYSEDIDYRRSLGSMSEIQLAAEILAVLKVGDFASRELTAIEIGKEILGKKKMEENGSSDPNKRI